MLSSLDGCRIGRRAWRSEAAELETIGLATVASFTAALVAGAGAHPLGGSIEEHALVSHAGAVAILGVVEVGPGLLHRRRGHHRRDQQSHHSLAESHVRRFLVVYV